MHVHVGTTTESPFKTDTEPKIDQSPSAVLRRIQLQLKDDADLLLQGRIRIIKYALSPTLTLAIALNPARTLT
jgi:hypothetical protein